MKEKNNNGKLILFCGKMGAGKSTLSKAIAVETNSVLISEDAWLSAHYPELIKTFDDYITYAQQIKPFVKQHVQNILKSGVTVVMDFPANTKKQRKWLLSISHDIDSNHELIYLNISDERCLSQISKRRKEQPKRVQFDTAEVFYEVSQYFEAPSNDEGLNITERL